MTTCLSWTEGKSAELCSGSSVRVSSASPSPTLLLQSTALPKQSCQTQHIMLCSALWEDAQARGCKMRLSSWGKYVTFNTKLSLRPVCWLIFSCKAKPGTIQSLSECWDLNTAPARAAVTHCVGAVLVNDDSVREGFIVGFDMQSPFSPVQRVLLDKVDIVHSSNLGKRHTFCYWVLRWRDSQKHKAGIWKLITFFNSRGASMSSLQRRSITWMAPSSLLYSLTVSLATNMGIRGHVGNLLSYACHDGKRANNHHH